MADPRAIAFSIDAGSWQHGNVPPALLQADQRGTLALDLDTVLLDIGIWTRPPEMHGFALSDCWAWLRYFPAFQPGPDVRLRPEWSSIDPHHKTVASADFGVGFGTRILCQLLGFQRYADTLRVVKVLEPNRWELGQRPSRGPQKSPDYVAYDRNGRPSVVEFKGGQSSRADLLGSIDRGILQKRNLGAVDGNAVIHQLVVGTYVPQSHQADAALVRIIDPDFEESRAELSKYSEEEIRFAVDTVTLAKEYSLVELAGTAAGLVRAEGEPRIEQLLTADLERSSARRTDRGGIFALHELFWSEPVVRGEQECHGVRFRAELPEAATDPAWLRRTLGAGLGGELGRGWQFSVTETGAVQTSPSGGEYSIEWLV